MFFKRLGQLAQFLYDLSRDFWQLSFGVWRISRMPGPRISIFGATNFPVNEHYFKMAHELGQLLMTRNISVITGGGPGIMRAASCGAAHVTSESGHIIGIGVQSLNEGPNPCVKDYFSVDQFFVRKWLMTRYSIAFVVFPGGFGTLDELFETITLMKTRQLARIPIVLFGVEFWTPFVDWLQEEAVGHGVIAAEDLLLFIVSDDIDEVFRHICVHCQK